MRIPYRLQMMRERWSVSAVPVLCAGTRTALRASVPRQRGLLDRAAVLGRPDLVRGFQASVQDAELQIQALAGERHWVNAAMAGLVLDAAQDCPGITSSDAPSSSGVVLVEEPLPALSTEAFGGLSLRTRNRLDTPYHDPVPVDGLAWLLTGDELIVWMLCRASRLPGALTEPPVPLAGFQRARVTMPAVFSPNGLEVWAEGRPLASTDALGPLSWLSTLWVMMRTPTVARTVVTDSHTGQRGVGGLSRQRRVTVIEMRPATHRAPRAGESSGRKLTTRHLVRGHWTHQPYGPGQSQRRLQWIEGYIRGPADAPLVERPRVWAWRK